MNKDYFTLWTAIAPSSCKMDFSIFIREGFCSRARNISVHSTWKLFWESRY